jgi:hypothetical protein
MYPSSGGGLKSRYVDGVLKFYNTDGTELYSIDPVNKKVSYGIGMNSVRIGDWVAAGALGSAVPFTTDQNVYSDGQLDVLAIFTESPTNLNSAYSAKAGRFRHLVNCTTAAHETYGVVGQLVAKATTLSHLHAGVMGTFEANTTAVVCSSSYGIGHAAVIARIGGHALITATTPLAGFLAFNNGSGALEGAASISAAFAASVRSSTYPWIVGMYFPAGVCVAGLVMGDKSSSAAIGHHIGVANSADTQGDKAIAIFADDGNFTLASDAQAINARVAILHNQLGAYALSCIRGHMRICAANIEPSEGKAFQAVSGVVETSGTPTIGTGSIWTVICGVNAAISAAGTTVAANAILAAIHITGTYPTSQSGEMIGILFEANAQGAEHTFGFNGVGATDGNGLVAQSGGSVTITHKIAVWINGVGTRYIPVGTI